jgi:hypothetical protein
MGLVETWVEERSWETIEKLLPKEYKWECLGAKRGKKKGRGAGGIITGQKLTLVENNDNLQQKDEDNNKACQRYNERKQRRMYRSKKLGKGEGGWEKKIRRQGGK